MSKLPFIFDLLKPIPEAYEATDGTWWRIAWAAFLHDLNDLPAEKGGCGTD